MNEVVVRAPVTGRRSVLAIGISSPLEDAFIASLIGWEVAAAIAPSALPTPSSLLRPLPAWARLAFTALLAGAVVVHLAREGTS